MKRREFDLLVRKLELETRTNDHVFAWFVHDGKYVVRTRRSHKAGDLPMGDAIRQQLKLNESQLALMIGCQLNRDDYVKILKDRNLL